MGLIGKLTKRGATDDEDDDLDLEDEDGSIDPESDAGASKVGMLSRLRGLRKRKESNDEDDDDDDDDAWDPLGHNPVARRRPPVASKRPAVGRVRLPKSLPQREMQRAPASRPRIKMSPRTRQNRLSGARDYR